MLALRQVTARPTWAGVGLLAALLVGLCGRPVYAQESELPRGAQDVGASPDYAQRRMFQVDSLAAFLGLGYLFTKDEQSEVNVDRTEHLLEERIGLGATGSIYSPNFMRYELAGVAGPSQSWAEDDFGSESDTGELYEGYAKLDLFPTRIHPANLYFSHIQDFQPRVFFTKVESTTTTYGARQFVRAEDWTLRFNAERREFDQEVFGQAEGNPFVDLTENSLGASGDYRISGSQTLSASYQFVDVDQSEAQNDFNSHNLLATHFLRFGSDDRHDLKSRLESIYQNGALDQEAIRWNERLHSQLTENLDGDVNTLLERSETNIVKIEQFVGDAGLEHQLFDSLNSSLRVQGLLSEIDDESTTDSVSGVLALRYRKTTPLGMFRMNYTNFVERRWVENDSGGVIDESHAFPTVAPEEVRLDRQFIDLPSIVVTDPTGLIFYRQGIDYTVRQDAQSFTFITREFTGLIPFGGTILVDYQFSSRTDFTLDTMNQTLRAEHEFSNGIAPYFAFRHQDQNLMDVDGPGGIEPIRERSLIGGLEWRGDWFLLGGEFEDRESTVLPFQAVRLHADASLQLQDVHSLTGGITQSWIYYEDPDRDVASTMGLLRWRSSIGSDLVFYLDGAARYDDDSFQGVSSGFSVTTGLEYRWRRFRFTLQAAHRQTNGVTSDFVSNEVGINIVREFGGRVPSLSAAVDRFLRR